MSDYRDPDYHNPGDPLRRGMNDSKARAVNATWGWIAAAVFLAVVLAVAFGIGNQSRPTGTNTASNDTTAPATARMAPPAVVPAPLASTPRPPAATPAPITPTPNSPAQRSPR
jgi:hypothetical protein